MLGPNVGDEIHIPSLSEEGCDCMRRISKQDNSTTVIKFTRADSAKETIGIAKHLFVHTIDTTNHANGLCGGRRWRVNIVNMSIN